MNVRRLLMSGFPVLYGVPSLIARVGIGYIFVTSGLGKLQHLDKVIEFFTQLGIPYPSLQAPFVASCEFFFGFLLMTGVLTRAACIPLTGIMIVAISTAKKDDISSVSDLFKVYEFLYILIMSWIVIEGPGRFSLDRLLERYLRNK